MRRTQTLLRLAEVLRTAPADRHWGYQLTQLSGIPSGVLHPILRRLLNEGWLTDDWEDAGAGRPARRYYRLTDVGRQATVNLPPPDRRVR